MKKQKFFALIFTFLMLAFAIINAHADNDLSDDIAAGEAQLNEMQSLYDEMQNKIDELEVNKENLSSYLASLNQSHDAAQMLISTYNGQIESKQADIDLINQKLAEAESQKSDQYEAMKLRIQYMYESGDMDIVNVIMSDNSLGDILNQAEYISKILEYDRSKMEDYENLLLTITVMKNQAETEMQNLNTLKSEQESVISDLSALMADASSNIKRHQEQISAAEQEALEYEEKIKKQKDSVEELKQEESRRIAESISESIRESEEASRRQALIDAGQKPEETTAFHYVPQTDDLTKLAAIIYCEAGGEPYEGQLAVGTVVMNRVASPKYGNTIEEVLMQPYQFTPVGSGRYAIALAKEPDPSCLKAATEVLINGVRTGKWLYFRTVNNIVKGDVIGNQVFY
ncbi:MAG: cell wall hydrolase [Lachnospiraceae bacterium]|nr:cell wall hydrolase [Lachnospiraceae bacterium]